ncbi:hypothetical protein GGU10DRAFT_350600 [Lentinula aff. detonsa]|uniref:Centrosomal protein ATPase n=1 Tax=Lentinula aff. detonsa TaxID=2804958 RepID=A0AA38KAW0_9AGAR|nr:hypothetical protein GGU10DRAFT_350600 [Lentinula aff. detonsa]
MNYAYTNHAPLSASSSFAGPSSSKVHGPFDDGKKEKRRKDLSGKVGKEISERREDSRHYAENINALISTTVSLSTNPSLVPSYNLRLLPCTLSRSALLYQDELSESYSLTRAQTAFLEEQRKVEEEWKKGRDRVRERLLEGIEERRKRAREDKEGEGTSADATLDSQNRPHITRKLRNKMGTPPPMTPLGSQPGNLALPNAGNPGAISNFPITSGPFLNPHSLSVDEIPSPFPLSLTATTILSGSGGSGGSGASSGTVGGGSAGGSGPGPGSSTAGGRRRPKGSGTHQSQAIGGLGKSLAMLSASKESEIEADLGEIRRGNKRRRAAVAGGVK